MQISITVFCDKYGCISILTLAFLTLSLYFLTLALYSTSFGEIKLTYYRGYIFHNLYAQDQLDFLSRNMLLFDKTLFLDFRHSIFNKGFMFPVIFQWRNVVLFLTLSFLRQVLTFSKRFAGVYAATNLRRGKFFFANLGLLFWQINKQINIGLLPILTGLPYPTKFQDHELLFR